MKKIFLTFSLIIVCFLPIVLLTGCGNSDKFEFEKAELKDEIYSIVVSNDIEEYSLVDEISVSKSYSWSVAKDKYGLTTFTTKTVPLSVGDNFFYIIVMDKNENSTTYKICIRRKPIYTITFNTDDGSCIKSQKIEEGLCVSYPEVPIKKGYVFSGWDFDFAQQVTSDITINAIWDAKKYNLYCYNDNEIIYNYSIKYDSNYTLNIPQQKGFRFEGWFLDDCFSKRVTDEKGQSISKWSYDSDLKLYAKFSLGRYNITINKSEAAAGSVSGYGTYDYGSTANLSAFNTQNGYIFKGWYLDDVCISSNKQYQFIVDDRTYEFEARWDLDLGGGAGTANSPYIISSMNSIYAIELLPTYTKKEANFKLVNDINFNGYSWYYSRGGDTYNGVFDGNGFTISNINKALFSSIEYSTIKNLTLINASRNFDGKYINCGLLVNHASSDSLIFNCNVTGNITGVAECTSYIGGIVGDSWRAEIKKSTFNGTINVSHSLGRLYVGGIVGTTTGGLEECKSLGKISTCSTDTVISGGIAGYSSSTLRNSFSTIELNCSNASEDMFIGGLLGQCTKLMNESYFNGIIQIENSYTSSNICVGGLVGYMNYDGKITNSFSDSAISINCNNTVSIGAIVGMIYEGTIENVFMVKTHDYKINNISCEYNNDFNDYGMVENCSNLNLLYTRCLNSWDDSVWDVKENEYPHLR